MDRHVFARCEERDELPEISGLTGRSADGTPIASFDKNRPAASAAERRLALVWLHDDAAGMADLTVSQRLYDPLRTLCDQVVFSCACLDLLDQTLVMGSHDGVVNRFELCGKRLRRSGPG